MENQKRQTVFDAFVVGANKGFKVGTTAMMPNVIMAFGIIKVLQLTGLLDLIGVIFQPIMALVGLPGVAATAWMAGLLSAAGGFGVAASLYLAGSITAEHGSILIVGVSMVGALLQYMGRLLGAADVNPKRIPMLYAISILNSFVGMIIMNMIIKFFY